MFVLLQIKQSGRQALRFGILNLVALYVIFGTTSFFTVLCITIAVWSSLFVIKQIKNSAYQRLTSLCGISLIVLLIVFFIIYKKHFDSVVLGQINPAQSQGIDVLFRIVSTISFSYVFIRILDLVRCVTWGQEKLINPIALAGYLAPFHMLIAGPLASYQEHLEMNKSEPPKPTIGHIIRCANTITTGLFFKVVIAQAILITRFGVEGKFEILDWTDACLLFLYLYFDFGGYSLVALGVGRLIGVPTPINFNKPFLSKSVTDFWGRWHVSLGVFIKNNIYWPLQFWMARRVKNPKIAEALSLASMCASFSAVAIWHRVTPRFFIWGVATSIIMLMEKYLQGWLLSKPETTRRWINKSVVVIGPVYTMIIIVLTIWYLSFELANI